MAECKFFAPRYALPLCAVFVSVRTFRTIAWGMPSWASTVALIASSGWVMSHDPTNFWFSLWLIDLITGGPAVVFCLIRWARAAFQ